MVVDAWCYPKKNWDVLDGTVLAYQHGPHFRVARLQEVGQLLGVLGLLGRTVATVALYHLGKGGCNEGEKREREEKGENKLKQIAMSTRDGRGYVGVFFLYEYSWMGNFKS